MNGLVLGIFAGVPAKCPRCGQRLGNEKLRGYRAIHCDRRPPLRGPAIRGARSARENRCDQPLLLWGFDGVTFVLGLTPDLFATVDSTRPLDATLEQLGLSGSVLQMIGRAA